MPRVLLIGIDGAPPALLERWMAEGELPALSALRGAGSFGVLRSTPSMTSPSAWTAIATGVNPGRHGIFGFFDRAPGTWRFRQNDARSRAVEPWWVSASRAGLPTATLNMPCSWPADEVLGIQVAGWLAPSDRSEGFTHPASLADEVRARFGAYPLHSDVQRLVASGRHEAARDRILANIRRKAEIAEHLLTRERWELMTGVFSDTDPAAHYYWHLTDPAHPSHDPRLRDEVGEIMLLAYREVDRAIERLTARLSDLDAVLVVSDHGAGPSGDAALYLPGLVDALGWQVRRRGPLRRVVTALQQRLPAGIKHRIGRAVGARGDERTTRLLIGDVDRRRTRVLSFYQGGRADLWLNPSLSAQERAATLREVRETLLECREMRGDVPAIAEIVASEEAYQGPHCARSPDLLVRWREDFTAAQGLRCGGAVNLRPELQPLQTGDHRPEGVIIAAGRGIAVGVRPNARVEDVAPTLLHLCGLPVPEDLDGRVIEEMLTGSLKVQGGAETRTRHPIEEAGEVNSATIERLRGLGYLADDSSASSRS